MSGFMRTRRLAPAALLACALALGLVSASSAVALAAGEEIAGDQRSATLVEQPKRFDGKVVSFRGEAIGDRMVRGDDAWIHLNDDAYELRNIEEGQKLGGYNSGMAVWVAAPLARRITYLGDHSHEGDVVRARGEFRAACFEHGGDMDIHATELEIVHVGRIVADPVKRWKTVTAAVTVALAALMFVAERKTRRFAFQRRPSNRRA